MIRMGLTLISIVIAIIFAITNSSALAADLTSTFGLEEAFIDAVGNCGPSSTAAGALGKTSDPAVQIALRNAEIIEAADAAAGVPGSSKALQDCMQKFLNGRGYNKSQMTVLPECTKQDWPSPFTSLGQCVHARGKMVFLQDPKGLSF
jgi:hypothetical protein